MTKFLKVTNAPFTGQLINLNGVKAVATSGATIAAQVDSDVYLEIVNSMEEALATSWQKAYFEIILPKAVTSIVNA